MEEKKLSRSRKQFLLNSKTMSLSDLSKMMSLCKDISEQLEKWPETDKKSLDPFLKRLKNREEDINTERHRRLQIVEKEKTFYDEIEQLFKKDPDLVSNTDLQTFYYLLEEHISLVKEIQNDGIPQHALNELLRLLKIQLDEVSLELSER